MKVTRAYTKFNQKTTILNPLNLLARGVGVPYKNKEFTPGPLRSANGKLQIRGPIFSFSEKDCRTDAALTRII